MIHTLELRMNCLDEGGFLSMRELLAFYCRKNTRYSSSQRDKDYYEYSRPCGMIFQCPLHKYGKGCQEITKEDWIGVFEKYDENRS